MKENWSVIDGITLCRIKYMNLIVCPKYSSGVDLCDFEFKLCFMKTKF